MAGRTAHSREVSDVVPMDACADASRQRSCLGPACRLLRRVRSERMLCAAEGETATESTACRCST
jgi:hypothetical protein